MLPPIKNLISTNPMTDEVLWEGKAATDADIDEAVAKAREAFPEWAALPLEKREEYLYVFQDTLKSNKSRFAEAISKETGKPLWESLTECTAMIAKVDISIEAQRKRCPEVVTNKDKVTSITRHKPHGVVAVFGPFNFPGHLPNGHIVPALLAGNTVVFKPSELTPYVGEELLKLWKLPQGVLNLVQGGPETGQSLSQHSDINALFFTGSWKTGKILAEQFGHHPEKILSLEMGGNNPLIIGEISDLEAAAYLSIQSAFLTAGQRCSCARRLIVPEGQLGDSFLQVFIMMIHNINVGPYTAKPEPFMGPVITEKAAKRLLVTQDHLKQKGGRLLKEMQLLQPDTPLLSPGVIDVTDITDRPDEEYFGPLLQVIRVPDFETAIEEANNTAYGLTSAILTDSCEQHEEFYKMSRAGIVNWNTQTTGASSAAPFGGIGHSGNYRPSAFYAADYCNFPVASLEIPALKLPDNITPGITL